MRTKGCSFRGTTSFRQTQPKEAFLALSVPRQAYKILQADQGLALTGSPVPVYSSQKLQAREFLRQLTRATFGKGLLWRLPANGLSFSGQDALFLLLPVEVFGSMRDIITAFYRSVLRDR